MLHDPTFWVATAFIAFIGLLIYLKVPAKIFGALDQRADKIRSDIEEAEVLCKEAQDLLATYQKKQREALKEAEEISQAGKAEAVRLAEKGQKQLEGSLARREKQATDRIAQAEAAAVEQVRNLTIEIAMAATRDILANQLSASKSDALVDSAIGELSEKLH